MLYLWPRKAGKIEKLCDRKTFSGHLVSLLVGYELISANQIAEYLISVDSLYNIRFWVRAKPHGSRLLSLYMYISLGSEARRGDISFITRGTMSYFVTSERSERALYHGRKSDFIFKLLIIRIHFQMNTKSFKKITIITGSFVRLWR